MKNRFFFLFLIFFPFAANAQHTIKISGYIKDSLSNEALIGANVFDINTQKGATTNSYGYYCLILTSHTANLQFSFVGYQPKTLYINCHSDSIINVTLTNNTNLKEVVIQNTSKSNNNQQELITPVALKTLPVIMGESDLTRTLSLLPGVSFGTENTCGYFVRGGNSDQNLLLIDGVPVYNAYHLFGFFSVFNTDAINKAKFYKGNIPARYSGRLSSVLDVQLKEGNSLTYSGEITLGMVASKFLVEGPILKGKTSFLVTGRRSMMDFYPTGFLRQMSDLTGLNKAKREVNLPEYSFYDITTKINHQFSSRSRLFLSLYNGIDKGRTENNPLHDKNNLKWGNTTSSMRWNYIVSPNLFSNLSVYYSHYSYSTEYLDNADFGNASVLKYKKKISSGIRDVSVKLDFDYSLFAHSIKFGIQYIIQEIKPGVTIFQSTGYNGAGIDSTHNYNKKVHSGILFIEDYIKFLSKLSCNAGLHFSAFNAGNTTYFSVQPRISLNYELSKPLNVFASYSRMVQPLHQLSSNLLGGPSDMWVPSTNNVNPSVANHLGVGLSYKQGNKYAFSVELFRKDMSNLIMYKEGASFMTEGADWQNLIEQGKGLAYGLEFLVSKEMGNTTGWIAYTWSKSSRQFGNINNGKVFPFAYDRTHSISVALMHKFSNKFDIGADWVFATGNRGTIADQFIYNDIGSGNYLRHYNGTNNYRYPSYHRLDMCINYRNTIKALKYTISAGAYNVYNKPNPYGMIDTPEGIYISTMFPVLPYLSISLKF